MEKVGIKQLKRDTSAILKRVREDNETIEVTYRGDTIAQIIPVMSGEARRRLIDASMARMDALAEEISESWPDGVSAVDAVREVRREL